MGCISYFMKEPMCVYLIAYLIFGKEQIVQSVFTIQNRYASRYTITGVFLFYCWVVNKPYPYLCLTNNKLQFTSMLTDPRPFKMWSIQLNIHVQLASLNSKQATEHTYQLKFPFEIQICTPNLHFASTWFCYFSDLPLAYLPYKSKLSQEILNAPEGARKR